jgi:glycosyltransferase involved in cell wall biosynthesis
LPNADDVRARGGMTFRAVDDRPRLGDSSANLPSADPAGGSVRILYSYDHVHLHTGSPRALLSVIDGLRGTRFSPVFLAKGDGPLVDALREREVPCVSGRAIPVSARHPLVSVRSVKRQLELLDNWQIDLLHLHESGWNYDLVLAAAIRRLPIVLHIHNPVSVVRRNVNWALAHQVVFVSEAHRASAHHLARIAAKSNVIYNAVDLDRFASGTSLRTSLGLAPSDFVIGIVSQISHRKGIDILLDAAAEILPKYPNAVFLVAGPPPPGGSEQTYVQQMQTRANDAAFGGRFRFIGARSDIPDFLATCDLLAQPTRAEPLGIAVIEAMAAGLPVVASRVGGIPEIITSPDLGVLVDSLDGASFAKGLDGVMRLPDSGRAVGAAGAASLRGRFDPQTIAARWRELYTDLVRAKRRD